MNIFFTAPYSGKQRYQKEYDFIRKVIESIPTVQLVSPEKGNYMQILTPQDPVFKEPQKRIHYEAIRKGIEWADVVILEISEECFQLGHEMTLAIQQKKHVLCLSLHENFERKIFSKYFHGARYELDNVEKIIKDFVRNCRKEQLPNRFNFFISNSQQNFLEEVAKQKGISIAEYLRELVNEKRSQI